VIFEKIKLQLRQVYDDFAGFWGADFTLHDWGYKELVEFVKQVKKKNIKILNIYDNLTKG